MRNGVNAFLSCGAVAALQALVALTALADPDGGESQAPQAREGEQRWVPSLAITGGATFQTQKGSSDPLLFEDMNPDPVPLRAPEKGDDLVVTPFVGASLEVMAPALPLPWRPRFFVSGEILPSFGSDRTLATQGEPDCVRGPEQDAPCATDEPPGARLRGFREDAANGVGTRVSTQMGLMIYGASLGAAFPVPLGERRLRIKPSISWINYEVSAKGLLVNAACAPSPQPCTNVYPATWMPGDPPLAVGFLRQPEALSAKDSKRFNGIGPGLDVEVDTGRFGPIGSALFLGTRAYYVLGNRDISFGTGADFDDLLGMDTAQVNFRTEVDPWLFRAHVGIRLQWLGGWD
jgi:hypothetical protein